MTDKLYLIRIQIKAFREFLINRCLSRDIVRNDRLYKEYIYIIRKYEEFFKIDE